MKTCLRQLSLFFVLFIAGSFVTAFSQDTETIHVSAFLFDQYTDTPLVSAKAELIHNDAVIASGYTDASGMTVLTYMVTGIPDLTEVVSAFAVSPVFPNPFHSATSVHVDMPAGMIVDVMLIGLLGQLLEADELFLPPGKQTLTLSMPHLDPGIYFLHVRAGKNQAKAIPLLKTGRQGESPGKTFSLQHNDAIHTTADWFDPLPSVTEKQLSPDFYIRVAKENYGTKDVAVGHGNDTTLHIGMDRRNKVVFVTADEQGNLLTASLRITGNFFNLDIASPETLTMASGEYTVKSFKGFIMPFEQVIEIPSVDTTIVIGVEKVESIIYNIENPSSEMLFVVENEAGQATYFYGLRREEQKAETGLGNNDKPGIDVTHLIYEHAGWKNSTIIFNEFYYPIMWTHPDMVIALYRGDSEFDPDHASHSFIHQSREDTATLNIRPDNLYALLDWFEEQSGQTYSSARNFLDTHTSQFEEIQQRAMASHQDQGLYIRAAITFSTLAAVRQYEKILEKQARELKAYVPLDDIAYGKTLLYDPNVDVKVLYSIPKEVLRNLLAYLIGKHFNLGEPDRSGPIVPIYVCNGATKYPYICHHFYFTGTVSQCLARCPVSIHCFTNICMPDVMNVHKALQIVVRY